MPSPASRPPATVDQLLERLRSGRSSSPRLIWYGPAGERVELSGRVLDNWVAKTANLLVEELDGGTGTRVGLDLPPHWRSAVWALAAWLTGCTVLVADSVRDGRPAAPADILVSSAPAGSPAPGTLAVAVALGALALRWDGELPPGTVDYAAEVRSYGDVFYPDAAPDPSDTALEAGSTRLSFAQLLAPSRAAAAAPTAGPQTVLVDGSLPLERVLREAVGVWAADGSVILVHPDVPVTEKLLQSERVSLRL